MVDLVDGVLNILFIHKRSPPGASACPECLHFLPSTVYLFP